MDTLRGNCIQAALVSSVGPRIQPMGSPEGGLRSYDEVGDSFHAQLSGALVTDVLDYLEAGSMQLRGDYLLHTELLGKGHCVLLQTDVEDSRDIPESSWLLSASRELRDCGLL